MSLRRCHHRAHSWHQHASYCSEKERNGASAGLFIFPHPTHLIHSQVFKKSINATLAAGIPVTGLVVPNIKRHRDAALAHEDLHSTSPSKASAHMYSVAADFGGACSVQIPIKLNKAAPSSARQPIACMADIVLTADQELLIKMTLGLVWAQINSLGASPLRPSQLIKFLRLVPFVASSGSEEVERDISLLEPMVLQVPPPSTPTCASATSTVARSFGTPSRACAGR